ncbi:hypothetical protein [Tuberibacillus calidus]|jgi:hypothetical protein|uniref:hypothetical protein n=1 Tax=Tuberibacillus calidus TaxID=340097 RepID=UPI000429F117|nr:hypothetical protein [Tuberibacillus calidus]
MSDNGYHDPTQFSDDFNHHFNQSTEFLNNDPNAPLMSQVDLTSGSYSNDILQYQDPLSHVHQFQFEPFHANLNNTHFVKPHYVHSYIKSDGTLVEGYYRDGDGNTHIDRPLDAGGGYMAGNPDGIKWNNINK